MKALALAALWVAASLGAVSVAWAGVNVVSSEVISPPVATFTAPAVVEPVIVADPPTDGEETTNIQGSSEAELSNPTPSTLSVAESEASADGGIVGSVDPETSGVVTTASTPDVAPTSTTTVPPSTTVPDSSAATPAPAETATFVLQGGTAAVSFSSTEVVVLWASAVPGFDVTIEPETPGWKVEFRSDTHRSRLDVWWSGGSKHEIDERPN